MIRPAAAPTRETLRRSIADQLLESLDQLVARHRARALHDEHIELHAELIAAEVAHQLAMAQRVAPAPVPAARRDGCRCRALRAIASWCATSAAISSACSSMCSSCSASARCRVTSWSSASSSWSAID